MLLCRAGNHHPPVAKKEIGPGAGKGWGEIG